MIVLLGLMTFGLSRAYYVAIREAGWDRVWAAQSWLDVSFLLPVAFVVALLGRRNVWSYAFLALVVGWIAAWTWLKAVPAIWYEWQIQGLGSPTLSLEFAVAALLETWLFAAFTFGNPSRRYFRVGRAADPAKLHT